jgi:hypothetical protein
MTESFTSGSLQVTEPGWVASGRNGAARPVER